MKKIILFALFLGVSAVSFAGGVSDELTATGITLGNERRTNWPTGGTASEIHVALSPTNYTVSASNVESHLVSIDGVLGAEQVARIEADSSLSNLVDTLVADPYQEYTTYMPVGPGGTCTITRADGNLVRIFATTNITIRFDDSYPTNGTSRVSVELWLSTNSLFFDSSSITADVYSIIIETNDWTSLMFRRTDASKWRVRQ